MKADEILREAARIIEERGKLRDLESGERSMLRAVQAYSALTNGKLETELDGWLFMCVLKMARATAGEPHLDDLSDLAGYAALAGECISSEDVEYNKSGFFTGFFWLENKSMIIPCPGSLTVQVVFRNGRVHTSRADEFYWDDCGEATIERYRIIYNKES